MKNFKFLTVLILAAALVGCSAGNSAETVSNTTISETTVIELPPVSASEAVVSEETRTTAFISEIMSNADTEITAAIPEKLIKFEDGEYYGYKDIDGNIVIPAEHRYYFDNTDITGMAFEVENSLYYIDKDGVAFLKMDDVPVEYTYFYNGFAFYDGRFIDEQGNTIYNSTTTKSIDFIRYWGNGYFESYYYPSYNGIGYSGHSSFIDAYGNEKVSTCNVVISELIDGYAIIQGSGWTVLVNDDLAVKAIFLNTITSDPNYVLTDLFYDYNEQKPFLRIRKGYKTFTESYDCDEIMEIKKTFGDDCDLENVSVYIYDGDKTKIYLEDWYGYDYDYEYDIADISEIINKDNL